MRNLRQKKYNNVIITFKVPQCIIYIYICIKYLIVLSVHSGEEPGDQQLLHAYEVTEKPHLTSFRQSNVKIRSVDLHCTERHAATCALRI
jgi:hypothetical protein